MAQSHGGRVVGPPQQHDPSASYEYRLEVIEEGLPRTTTLLCRAIDKYQRRRVAAARAAAPSVLPAKRAHHAQICKPLGQILGAKLGQAFGFALSARVLADVR